MAVICGRGGVDWTLPIELTRPHHFSNIFSPFSFCLLPIVTTSRRRKQKKIEVEKKQNNEKSVLAAEKKETDPRDSQAPLLKLLLCRT